MKTFIRFIIAFALIVMMSNAVNAQPADQPDREYNQFLISALNDSNVGIRGSAAELLGQRKVQQAVDPLITMLKTEHNNAVRILVALALYNIGDTKALPALKKASQHDKCSSVRHVARGIVRKMETVEVAVK